MGCVTVTATAGCVQRRCISYLITVLDVFLDTPQQAISFVSTEEGREKESCAHDTSIGKDEDE